MSDMVLFIFKACSLNRLKKGRGFTTTLRDWIMSQRFLASKILDGIWIAEHKSQAPAQAF
jgi:hypothetical protein